MDGAVAPTCACHEPTHTRCGLLALWNGPATDLARYRPKTILCDAALDWKCLCAAEEWRYGAVILMWKAIYEIILASVQRHCVVTCVCGHCSIPPLSSPLLTMYSQWLLRSMTNPTGLSCFIDQRQKQIGRRHNRQTRERRTGWQKFRSQRVVSVLYFLADRTLVTVELLSWLSSSVRLSVRDVLWLNDAR